MYFRISIILATLIIGCQEVNGFSDDIGIQEFREVIEETIAFSVDDPYIYIYNRYGNVDISTTSDATASLVATIIVEASNKQRADKIMGRIDVDIKSTKKSLQAVTSIENNDGWNLTKSNESYHIHYTIKIPKSSSLSIENKYGNISITDLNNDLDIELKHGNAEIQDVNGNVSLEIEHVNKFSLGNVSGNADIELQHSKFSMQNVSEVDIESKHSDISINNALSISSETKHDDIRINKVGHFTNEGKYDDIEIGTIDKFAIETKFAKIDIGTLNKTGLFYTENGKVSIEEVSSGFEEIEIESKHTGFQFYVSGGYSLNADVEHTSLSYPDDFDISYIDDDKNDIKIKGSKPGSGSGKISARMKHGKLRIRD